MLGIARHCAEAIGGARKVARFYPQLATPCAGSLNDVATEMHSCRGGLLHAGRPAEQTDNWSDQLRTSRPLSHAARTHLHTVRWTGVPEFRSPIIFDTSSDLSNPVMSF